MKKQIDSYPLYKGLQKPLIFKGFKGRYIYWGMGAIGSAVIIGCIGCIFLDKVVGLAVMAIFLGISLFVIYRKQEQGLYSKKRDNNVLHISKNYLK